MYLSEDLKSTYSLFNRAMYVTYGIRPVNLELRDNLGPTLTGLTMYIDLN